MTTAPAPVTAASLYVGDLDRDVTEAVLYDTFSQIGPVASIRVCRDAVTRRSLGYAYVNYNTALDENAAVRALEELNYVPLNGRPMRIMWSHRDPSTRRNGVGNIFIKSLEESIDQKALHDTFSAFGNILSCKIAMNEGKSRGYGFVHFETQEAADLAIEKVNGMLLEGKKVFVGKFLKRSERTSNIGQQIFTNVFIKNLDEEISEVELKAKFEEIGPVTNVIVMKDDNGGSKGFGFVNFDDPDHARIAVETLNESEFGSKQIFVARAQKKSERMSQLKQLYEERRQERLQKYQGVNLYIKNIDDSIDDEKLKQEFSGFGNITSAKIMLDEKNHSRGFGFVCFTTPEEANRALAEANGRMVCGKPIYVALAQRKELRRQQLEQMYAAYQVPNQMLPPGAPMMRQAPPGMFPPTAGQMYYQGAPPNMISGPPQTLPPGQRQPPGPPGMMYHQNQPQYPSQHPNYSQNPNAGMMGGRPWRPTPMQGQPMRPGFQPMPYGPMGINQRNQRQNRQRPIIQNQNSPVPVIHSQGQPPVIPGPPQPMGGQMMAPVQGMKDMPRNQQRNGRPQQAPPQYNKYHPHVLNPNGRMYSPQMLPNGMPMGGPLPVGGTPLANGGQVIDIFNPSALASASPEEQKQLIGERLFPLIQRHQPELAGKITGMLLEMDNSELLLLLESPDSLLQKVDEAIIVLQQHTGPEGEESSNGQGSNVAESSVAQSGTSAQLGEAI